MNSRVLIGPFETFPTRSFETKEVHKGNVTHNVIASSGDVLILTAKSYPAFLQFIQSKNSDPTLDIEEAADLEYSINNPHS